jgi:hypothetical protein
LWRCQRGPEGGGGGAVRCGLDNVHWCGGDGMDPTAVEVVREVTTWTQRRRSGAAWTRWCTLVRRRRHRPNGGGGGVVRCGPDGVHRCDSDGVDLAVREVAAWTGRQWRRSERHRRGLDGVEEGVEKFGSLTASTSKSASYGLRTERLRIL